MWKLSKPDWKARLGWLAKLRRPSASAMKRISGALALTGVAVLAFLWGRQSALRHTPTPDNGPVVAERPVRAASDYGQRVVAYIYNNIPITREDYGEYLIARSGPERVELLVQRRIIDMACQARGVFVTDAEVQAQFELELQASRLTEKDFAKVLRERVNKTLYEYKEDGIRRNLALAKLARPMIQVTQKDLEEGFEARYGEQVECRMIVLERGDPHRYNVWEDVAKSPEAFLSRA